VSTCHLLPMSSICPRPHPAVSLCQQSTHPDATRRQRLCRHVLGESAIHSGRHQLHTLRNSAIDRRQQLHCHLSVISKRSPYHCFRVFVVVLILSTIGVISPLLHVQSINVRSILLTSLENQNVHILFCLWTFNSMMTLHSHSSQM